MVCCRRRPAGRRVVSVKRDQAVTIAFKSNVQHLKTIFWQRGGDTVTRPKNIPSSHLRREPRRSPAPSSDRVPPVPSGWMPSPTARGAPSRQRAFLPRRPPEIHHCPPARGFDAARAPAGRGRSGNFHPDAEGPFPNLHGCHPVVLWRIAPARPAGTFTPENDRDRALVELPLHEVLARIIPACSRAVPPKGMLKSRRKSPAPSAARPRSHSRPPR